MGSNGQQIRNLLFISVLERCGVLGCGGSLVGSDPVALDEDLVHYVDGGDGGGGGWYLSTCNVPWDLLIISYPAHADRGRRGSRPRPSMSPIILKGTTSSL